MGAQYTDRYKAVCPLRLRTRIFLLAEAGFRGKLTNEPGVVGEKASQVYVVNRSSVSGDGRKPEWGRIYACSLSISF